MKLLIYSHFFAPNIGGVENIVMSLARGLAELRSERGNAKFQITLVTETPVGSFDDLLLPFRVFRHPNFWALCKLLWRADVYSP
jgi:hypothetical protein